MAKNPSDFGKTLLMNQFRQLCKNPPDGFSMGLVDDNIFEWKVMMEGPEDTDYEGGYFPCRLSFTSDYPNSPPTMRFMVRPRTPQTHLSPAILRHSPSSSPHPPLRRVSHMLFLRSFHFLSFIDARLLASERLRRRQGLHFDPPRGQGGPL
jgi:hypothetical protein